MLCIAIRNSSLLALSVQVTSMLYLGHFSDLESFVILFQSMFRAQTLALVTPLMLYRVDVLCLMNEPLCMPPCLGLRDAI